MIKTLIASFLIAHGVVHAAVWALPKTVGDQPFDPGHSWLLERIGIAAGSAEILSIVLALGATFGFVASGIALIAGSDSWRLIALITAAESLPLFLLFFNPWLIAGIAIQLGILYALGVSHWPTVSLVGA